MADKTDEQLDELEAKLEAAELRAEAAEQALKDALAAKGIIPAPAKRTFAKTKEGSHVATMRGYVNGHMIEEGMPVPAGIPVSTEWMAPAKKAKAEDEAEAEAE
jgi:hypothetical protein